MTTLSATKMNTTTKAYTILTFKGSSTVLSKNSSGGFWKAKCSLFSSINSRASSKSSSLSFSFLISNNEIRNHPSFFQV